jgi:hypothetical protein
MANYIRNQCHNSIELKIAETILSLEGCRRKGLCVFSHGVNEQID